MITVGGWTQLESLSLRGAEETADRTPVVPAPATAAALTSAPSIEPAVKEAVAPVETADTTPATPVAVIEDSVDAPIQKPNPPVTRSVAAANVPEVPSVASSPVDEPEAVAAAPVTALTRWTSDWVNVRQARSRESAVVRVLDPGQRVLVGNLGGHWWEVYVDGRRIGFVANSVLTTEPPTG